MIIESKVRFNESPIQNYFCLLDTRTPQDKFENKESEYVHSLSDILLDRKHKLSKANGFTKEVDVLNYNGCVTYTPYSCNTENGHIITTYAMNSNRTGIDYEILRKEFMFIKDWMIRNDQLITMASNFYREMKGNKRIVYSILHEIFDNYQSPTILLVKPIK